VTAYRLGTNSTRQPSSAGIDSASSEVSMEIPDPQYVRTSDGAYIAYQVVGDGPVDIALQLDFGTNLDRS
jgi:hypothetical protein